MNYVWKITGLTSANISDLSGVVINARWSCTGTNETGQEGVFNGATPLTTQDIDPATFVPFDQLTEELVLSWVEPLVVNNEDYWEHINNVIAKDIIAKTEDINPAAPLPWNPPEPTPEPLPTINPTN